MAATLAVRPAYRPYAARVSGVRRLSPGFVRITLGAEEFEHFGTAGVDQRVKLVLPHPGGGIAALGQHDADSPDADTWYDRWRALPDAERNPFRTYTVRAVRPESCEVDIDFVVHEGPGPAGAWAEAAAPGDEIVIVGPDIRSPEHRQGIDWHPGSARRVLLAGDETAVPAVSGILASLDAAWQVDVLLEVPDERDALPLQTAARAAVTWLPRGRRAHGEALVDAVAAWTARERALLARAASPRPQQLDEIDVDRELLWDSPADGEGEFYAWIAGESAMVKALRRHLVSGCGVDRRRVAFMGYWRRGQAERTA